MIVNPEDRETFRKSQIDQFLAHVAETYLKQTGVGIDDQIVNDYGDISRKPSEAMVVLATILSTTGQGTLATEGPDHAARAMIGACEIIREAWGE